MKKIILLMLSFVVLLFPANTLATTMELVVTITSFTVPARDTFTLEDHDPSGQYSIASSRIITVDKNNKYVAERPPITGSYDSVQYQGYLRRNAFTVLSFPYIPSLAPYKVYAEIELSDQNNNIVCSADCIPISANSGWFYTYSYLYHFDDGSNADCEGTCFDDNNQGAIAINPNNGNVVAKYDDINTHALEDYYWRSQVLYTTN